MRERDYKHALFPASAILSDSAIDTLASVGPILNLISLEEALPGGTWEWFGKYGNELLDHMRSLSIPPMQPKPKPAPKTTKRPVDDENMGVAAKRARTTAHVPNQTTPPTPVTSTPRSISETRPPPQTPRTHLPSQSQPSTQPGLANNPYSGYLNFGSSPYYRSYIGSSSSPIPSNAPFQQPLLPYYRSYTLPQPPPQPIFTPPTPNPDRGPSPAP